MNTMTFDSQCGNVTPEQLLLPFHQTCGWRGLTHLNLEANDAAHLRRHRRIGEDGGGRRRVPWMSTVNQHRGTGRPRSGAPQLAQRRQHPPAPGATSGGEGVGRPEVPTSTREPTKRSQMVQQCHPYGGPSWGQSRCRLGVQDVLGLGGARPPCA
jgi:hypothetical protein